MFYVIDINTSRNGVCDTCRKKSITPNVHLFIVRKIGLVNKTGKSLREWRRLKEGSQAHTSGAVRCVNFGGVERRKFKALLSDKYLKRWIDEWGVWLLLFNKLTALIDSLSVLTRRKCHFTLIFFCTYLHKYAAYYSIFKNYKCTYQNYLSVFRLKVHSLSTTWSPYLKSQPVNPFK